MVVTYRPIGEVARKIGGQTLVVVGLLDQGTEVDWTCDNSVTSAAQGTLVQNFPEVAPGACKP
jgi:hypothetical protein